MLIQAYFKPHSRFIVIIFLLRQFYLFEPFTNICVTVTLQLHTVVLYIQVHSILPECVYMTITEIYSNNLLNEFTA